MMKLIQRIAPLLLGSLLQAQVPTTDPTPRPPAIVPVDIQATIHPVQFQDQRLVGLVSVSPSGKSVSIRWSYNDENGARQFYVESLSVPYWPTAASRVGDQRLSQGEDLLVAGKRTTNGNTVIERWELSWSGIPGPESATAIQATTLYDTNVVGRRIVRSMAPVNSVAGKALVHFEDSGDLYQIDAASGNLSLQLTPAVASDLGVESMTHWWSGKLPGNQYVYVYQSDFADYDDGLTMFYDVDADGVFDHWTHYDEDQWDQVKAIAQLFESKFNP